MERKLWSAALAIPLPQSAESVEPLLATTRPGRQEASSTKM
jgi:hypothetical protein